MFKIPKTTDTTLVLSTLQVIGGKQSCTIRSFLPKLGALASMAQTWIERKNFNYTMKNIPLPTNDSYRSNLLAKIESFINRMKWKPHFFIYPSNKSNIKRFALQSTRSPPQVDELKPFENELLRMLESLKFRQVHDEFQSILKQDVSDIMKFKKA